METGLRLPRAHPSALSQPLPAANKPLSQGSAENRCQQLITDVQVMSGYLRSISGGHTHPYLLTRAEVLEYEPGHRSLVLYTGIHRHNGHPWVLLGKWFAEFTQATQLFQLLQALQTIEPLSLQVARPIALLPELSLVLYDPQDEPIRGCSLGELLKREDGFAWMRRSGEWLAHFHASHLPISTQFHFNKEFFTLHRWMEALQHFPSSVVESANVLISYLHRSSNQLNFEFDTPIHRNFYYGTLFVDQTLCVTDFDEVCLGDPNFDLAHFSAYLTFLSYQLRQTTYGLFDQWQAFLDGYASQTGWKPDERFDYFYVYACLKIAWQLATGACPLLHSGEQQRVHLIEMILKQGLIIQ